MASSWDGINMTLAVGHNRVHFAARLRQVAKQIVVLELMRPLYFRPITESARLDDLLQGRPI
jgi:hypothetical protein